MHNVLFACELICEQKLISVLYVYRHRKATGALNRALWAPWQLLCRLAFGNGNYAGFFINNPDVINITIKIISKVNVNKPPGFNLIKLLINCNKKVKKVNIETVILIQQFFIITANITIIIIIILKFNKN